MIVRRADVTPAEDPEDRAAELGAFETLKLSDAGALTQFGGYLETLQPGSRSSVRHWHERCDEMLHVVAGEVTVVEEDGEHVLLPGDTACWPAGVANAHHAVNRTARPCSYRPNEKGRVERAIRDVREGFFEARSFASVEDLNAQARTWCQDIARDRRVPDAKDKTMADAFVEELPRMIALPDDDFPVEERSRSASARRPTRGSTATTTPCRTPTCADG